MNLRIRAIKTLTTKLGIDDETYRDMLRNGWGVNSSTELTDEQQDTLIVTLKTLAGQADARRIPRKDDASAVLQNIEQGPKGQEREHATPAMQRRLKFHAIRCGIHYTDAQDLGSFCEEGGTGEILQGEELRRWLRRRWDGIRTDDPYRHVEMPIPQIVLRRMYERWINPTSNRMLVEGNFKRYFIDPSKVYYHELSPKAVDHLISRYRAMHAVLDAQDQRAQMPL